MDILELKIIFKEEKLVRTCIQLAVRDIKISTTFWQKYYPILLGINTWGIKIGFICCW